MMWRFCISLLLLLCVSVAQAGTVISPSTGSVLAVYDTSPSGGFSTVRVWPQSTDKPDEGDASVKGTLAWALARLSSGGELIPQAGTFSITTSLVMSVGNTSLRCASLAATLKLTTNANVPILKLGQTTQRTGLIVENCTFDANYGNNTTGAAILVSDVARSRIMHNDIGFWDSYGVRIDDANAATVEMVLAENFIHDGDGPAVTVVGSTASPTDTRIEQNEITGGASTATSDPVVNITATAGLLFKLNHVYGGSGNGHTDCVLVNHAAGTDAQFVANEIENCQQHGFNITTGAGGLIDSNLIYVVSEATNDTYDAIHLSGNQYVVSNNVIRSGASGGGLINDGIEAASSNNGIFIGNKFAANASSTGVAIRITAGGTNIIGLNYNPTTAANQYVVKSTDLILGNPTMDATSLPAAANGSQVYCSDCTVTNPCAGAGSGAFAKRIAAAWVCN